MYQRAHCYVHSIVTGAESLQISKSLGVKRARQILKYIDPRINRVSKKEFGLLFPEFGPDLGPGHLQLDSGRRHVAFAAVFASVASLAVSFVPKSIFWNLADKKVKKWLQDRASVKGNLSIIVQWGGFSLEKSLKLVVNRFPTHSFKC